MVKANLSYMKPCLKKGIGDADVVQLIENLLSMHKVLGPILNNTQN